MPKLGVLSVFHVNLATWDIPTWATLPLISDCNVNAPWDEGDASARLSRAKSAEPTMMGLEITGKIRVKGADVVASYFALYNAHFRDLIVDILALNGPLAEVGAEGYRFEAKVFNWGEDQSLGAVLYKDFSIKPCIPSDVTRYPKKAIVVAPGGPGNVTYNDIGQG